MNFYVCAGSSEMPLARSVMASLRTMGHAITHDWVAEIERAGGNANPRDATEEQRRAWSYADLAGVERADVFWMLVPERPSFGASFEFSFAVFMQAPSAGRLTIVSGDWRQSIFTSLASHRFDDHEQALIWVRENLR